MNTETGSSKNSKFSLEIFQTIRNNFDEYVPIIGLIGLVIFFSILTNGKAIAPTNIEIIVNQAVILAISAIGCVFIYSMGSFDLSVGVNVALCATVGARIFLATHSYVLMCLAILVTGVAVSLFNATLVSLFKLPAFIVTLAMMNILAALVRLLLGNAGTILLKGTDSLTFLDSFELKVVILILFFVVSLFIFNYTWLGRANKAIGGNPTVAKQSGISITRNTLLSFLITGIGVALASFLLLVRTSSASALTGASYGFDIIIAIVLGGMSISGGAKSKVSAALIGAFTITILNNGLVLLGVSIGFLQIVRGTLFVLVLVLTGLKTRSNILVR